MPFILLEIIHSNFITLFCYPDIINGSFYFGALKKLLKVLPFSIYFFKNPF